MTGSQSSIDNLQSTIADTASVALPEDDSGVADDRGGVPRFIAAVATGNDPGFRDAGPRRGEEERRRRQEAAHGDPFGLNRREEAFRIEKSQLEIRPVYHQKQDRVRAHIFVCFLAYVLRKTLEGWSERAGLGRSPGKLLEEVARIQSTDVVLPTRDGRVVRLRCVVQPDRAQRILLDHLGLTLPQRLRVPKGVAPM